MLAAMKFALLATLLASVLPATQAEETAYTALRVVGRSQGKEALNHVLELRGRGGSPHPAVWKITLDEPRARGGVRQMEVQSGRIISERTPAAASTPSSPMNFAQLNLDSDGAFTVANEQARKAGVPFDTVDYLLHSGSAGGTPVWHLELSDAKLGKAGSIDIAADTGTILRQSLQQTAAPRAGLDRIPPGRRPPPPPPPDDSYVGNGGRAGSGSDGGSQPGEPFRGVADFFRRVGKRFEKRGTQLENFFTGKGARADRERYREDYRDGR